MKCGGYKEWAKVIRIAVCDDELSAVQSLENQINLFFTSRKIEYSVLTFFDGNVLLKNMSDNKEDYDIIFLDIQMEKVNGMEIAKAIRDSVKKKVYIIFVTAFQDYVFDAFDVNAYHYLIKPVVQQKLFAVLGKIITEIVSSVNQFLVIHKTGIIDKIFFSKIMYCEVVNHRVFIYEQNKIHEYSGKIDDLEKELDKDFIRCHRSFIVNLKYVNSYKDGFVYMPSEEKVPVATRRQTEFMKALLIYQRKEVR